jgi:hypothetical protein
MPNLFGAGGWQDGATALIATHKNVQTEESMALHGNGERAIDENIAQHSIANANTEFNYSQFKNGAVTNADPQPRFSIIGGLTAGDYNIKMDPYAATQDVTTQALGDIMSVKYKLNGESPDDQVSVKGANPFVARGGKAAAQSAADGATEGFGQEDPKGDQEDESDISYYFNDGYVDPTAAEQVNRNYSTGLRRANAKTSQSKQLERVAQKDDIMRAYQEANESYAETMKTHFKAAYQDSDQREETIDRLRQPNSKYYSSQMGVGDVSRDTAKAYKKKKQNGPTKLNTQLVGV